MSELKIRAATEKGKGPSMEVAVDFPDDVAGVVKKYGEAPTYSRVRAAFVIDMQSIIRTGITAKKKSTEVAQLLEEYKPGVKAKGKTVVEKAESALASLSESEKADLLAKFGVGKGKK